MDGTIRRWRIDEASAPPATLEGLRRLLDELATVEITDD
jgi:hypothetical protein